MQPSSSLFILLLILIAIVCHASFCVDAAFVVTKTQIAQDVSQRIRDRLATAWTQKFNAQQQQCSKGSESFQIELYIGDVPVTRSLIQRQELQQLKDESFIVRSQLNSSRLLIAADGKDTRGVIYGIYYIIEEILGVSFRAHPFQPLLHMCAAPHTQMLEQLFSRTRTLDVTEEPYFRIRGVHLHTVHPLELTELLNGFGTNFSIDSFEVTFEYIQLCEWLIANRANRFEFVLLYAAEWDKYADSTLRQSRLKQLTSVAHEFGLKVLADAAIALRQQHVWALYRPAMDDPRHPLTQINARIDWLIGAGFDAISTEIGFSEFTHGSVEDMLKYLNVLSERMEQIGSRAYTKVHISVDQIIPQYIDPVSGKPGMNYNFLPFYAREQLGIMPHTVQFYALDDPAFTYNTANFSFMREFIVAVAQKQPNRENIWYPESAYWIQYDINVPLFLPVYLHRRIKDLHDLDARVKHAVKGRLDGQFFFSSGWEFNYWLIDVFQMRAAWNPRLDLGVDAATDALLSDVLRSFDASVEQRASKQIGAMLSDLMKSQVDLLIFGGKDRSEAMKLFLKSGIAYLQGADTWSDLGIQISLMTGKSIETNPRQVSLFEVAGFGSSMDGTVRYEAEIAPLLQKMDVAFNTSATALRKVSPNDIQPGAISYFEELMDSSDLLALRARFVSKLYEYAFGRYKRQSSTWLDHKAKEVLALLQQATSIIKRRLSGFRVPVDRIAGWRSNPSTYRFTYLWHSKTLYFWWRDFLRITQWRTNPCFMNLINPIDVVAGEGIPQSLLRFVVEFLEHYKSLAWVAECLKSPTDEPRIPPQNFFKTM